MALFSIEHRRAAYRSDFAIYGSAVALLAGFLLIQGPREQRLVLTALAVSGLATWTAIEYLLHRFVLHGLAPFKRWHLEHHQRPVALICTPTILSASLIFVFVFLPAFALGGMWRGLALGMGILVGYLFYAITHHATHHWRADSAWLKRRKRWHARHHTGHGQNVAYGVTTAFWDHVFGSVEASKPLPRSA